MGFDHVDVIYALPPPEGLSMDELVGSVAELVSSGKARAWAIVNWPAASIVEASRVASRDGLPQPCAAQLAYSLVQRSPVEDGEMRAALAACAAPVVASFVLTGGVLTGKYDTDPTTGRAASLLAEPREAAAAVAARPLAELARQLDTTPAALAVAFALANPDVASVLFGATSPAQLRENASSVDVLDRLTPDGLARLRAIGRPH
jgi:aryl-alcohol dehydrogenase-like predicted oxidoreductase